MATENNPAIQDIIIPPTLARQNDRRSIHRMLTLTFLIMRRNFVAAREQRQALIDMGDITAIGDAIAALNLTASGTYQQSEIQSISDKLDEVITRLNEIGAAVNALRDASDTNLKAASGDETTVT